MLLGLLPPTSGQIFLLGEPLYPLRPSRRLNVGVVLEQHNVYPELTAAAYLAFFGRLYGVQNLDHRIDERLGQVDLAGRKHSKIGGFSRGMRLKLDFARATLHDPQILILDEPVEGLDPYGIQEVRQLLLQHHQRGNTIVITSHILSEVEQIAGRVGVMNEGRMLAIGDMAALRRSLEPESELMLEIDGTGPHLLDTLRALPFVRSASEQKGMFHVHVPATGDYRADLARAVAAQGAVVVGMKQSHFSLEQAFTQITTGNVSLLAQEPSTPPVASKENAGPLPAEGPAVDSAPASQEKRMPIIYTLTTQLLRNLLASPTPYFVLAFAMLAGGLLTRSYLSFAASNDLIVLPRPWYLPFIAGSFIISFWMGFSSTTTVVQERLTGTLQLLFIGPVDEIGYFSALYLSRLATFVLWNVIFIFVFLIYGYWSGFRYGWDLLLAALYSLLPFSILTAMGFLIGALIRSLRGAAVVFLALAGGLAALLGVRDLLTGLSLGERSFALSYVRDALAFATNLLRWLSPYEYLLQGVDAVHLLTGLLLVLAGLLYALLLMAAAVLALRRGNVLP